MSTVQECIAAHHIGMNVFAISIITDLAVREENNLITHEEVLKAALETEPKLALLLRELIGTL
jgi:purine-nucleoside phosphorylase